LLESAVQMPVGRRAHVIPSNHLYSTRDTIQISKGEPEVEEVRVKCLVLTCGHYWVRCMHFSCAFQ